MNARKLNAIEARDKAINIMALGPMCKCGKRHPSAGIKHCVEKFHEAMYGEIK